MPNLFLLLTLTRRPPKSRRSGLKGEGVAVTVHSAERERFFKLMVTGININNINTISCNLLSTLIIFKMPTDVTVSCCRNVATALVMLKAVVTSNGELTPNFRYIADLRQQKKVIKSLVNNFIPNFLIETVFSEVV